MSYRNVMPNRDCRVGFASSQYGFSLRDSLILCDVVLDRDCRVGFASSQYVSSRSDSLILCDVILDRDCRVGFASSQYGFSLREKPSFAPCDVLSEYAGSSALRTRRIGTLGA